MPNYGKTALSAFQSIKKNGLAITLSRAAVSATYDPVAGEDFGAQPATNYLTFAVVLPATVARFRGIDNKLTEDLILQKARYLLAPALTVNLTAMIEPLPEDRIAFDGKNWKVLGCSPLNPAGTALIYQIGVLLIP